MAKTDKNNNKNNKNKFDKKNAAIAILSLLVVVLGVLSISFASSKRISDIDEQRLSLHKHLLNRHIAETCRGEHDGEYEACGLVEEGISKDNDLYAKIWCQKYDRETQQLVGEKRYRTLYFQHDEGAIDGYAEAYDN